MKRIEKTITQKGKYIMNTKIGIKKSILIKGKKYLHMKKTRSYT